MVVSKCVAILWNEQARRPPNALYNSIGPQSVIALATEMEKYGTVIQNVHMCMTIV